jgi:hypothetical protein
VWSPVVKIADLVNTNPRRPLFLTAYFLARGLAEPAVEARRADARVVAWDERLIVQFHAEIERVGIYGQFAGTLRRFQESPDEFAEAHPLRTGDLDRAIHRCGKRDVSHCISYVVGRDGLYIYGGQVDSLRKTGAFSRFSGTIFGQDAAGFCYFSVD